MHDLCSETASVTSKMNERFCEIGKAALVINMKCLNAIALQQVFEVAPATGNRDGVTLRRLCTCKVNRSMNVSVQPSKVIENMHDAHC
jgi:hypothetical protein